MKGEILLVEYLYDAIRAVAGQDIIINAFITDDQEVSITTGCSLVLYDKTANETLLSIEGKYLPDNLMWEFNIPAIETKGLNGRYWYAIQYEGNAMCFKQPIYLL